MNVAAESQQAVEVPADVPVYSIRDSWRFAALLFAIDAICLGQFGFAVLLFGWTVLVRAPMIPLAWKDKLLQARARFSHQEGGVVPSGGGGQHGLFLINRLVPCRRLTCVNV